MRERRRDPECRQREKTLQEAMDDVNAARRDLLDAVAESWPGRQLIRFVYWLDRELRRWPL